MIVEQIRYFSEYYTRKAAVEEFYATMSAVHSMLQLFSLIKCGLLPSLVNAQYIATFASVWKSAVAVGAMQHINFMPEAVSVSCSATCIVLFEIYLAAAGKCLLS